LKSCRVCASRLPLGSAILIIEYRIARKRDKNGCLL
jgi:hypothetical protein